ncbi:fasciclin domain-containing protein [Costertonia aggregata]|uniref:Fasciclin domain-containing protein n=1 Tax=Costertonia aggregata TaxID=343403 RepID=A0A7H9ASS5_9FLAO|nr:fasciclin domain-containing protein [Costertonia aggregata]QLG46528.1 fasciclin domain-containing protein [Costertonia aggregata]
MKRIKSFVFGVFITLAVIACKDTANTTIKEDNKDELLEDRTPVLKEQWKQNMNDWREGDDRDMLKTIISNTSDFDRFVKALRSADMYIGLDELEEATMFIPTNTAFERLNDSRLAELKTPDEVARMTEILKYHIVPEEYDIHTLLSTVRLNEGVLRLQTLQGGYLAFSIQEDQLIITDEMGNVSNINMPDMEASNGVIHGIDDLLTPQ